METIAGYYKIMLENICVLNHYCKLVKKERKTEKKRKGKSEKKKETCKTCYEK